MIQLSYHGEAHYNSVRDITDPDIGQPAVHLPSNLGPSEVSQSSKSVSKVLQSAPWCSVEEIEAALKVLLLVEY